MVGKKLEKSHHEGHEEHEEKGQAFRPETVEWKKGDMFVFLGLLWVFC